MNPSLKDWRQDDPAPGIELQNIMPVSKRALAFLVRNKTQRLSDDFLRFIGAVEMIEGLDYHHHNFVQTYAKLFEDDKISGNLRHEAVAYLNRMGQIRAFARAVSSFLPNAKNMIPKIEELSVFRDKHAAHRSMDVPRADDTAALQVSHALSLSQAFGYLISPRPGRAMPMLQDSAKIDIQTTQALNRRSGCMTFQLFDVTKNTHVNFTPEVDHEFIANEAYIVLSSAIMVP